MSSIKINIFNVNVPSWGGVFRTFYLMNSPVIDYSFHLFDALEKETEEFVKNLVHILEYKFFADYTTIEVSFDKKMKMPVGGADQKGFINLCELQQEEVLNLLNSRFPNYDILITENTDNDV